MLRSLFVFLTIFASIPFIIMKPHVGILVWSWISYMNPHRLTYGIAFHFNFLDYVAVAALFSALITREPKKLPKHPLVYLLAIYLSWVTLTTVFAALPDMAWEKWMNIFKIMLFTFMTLMFINTKMRLQALMWVIVLSIGFFSTKGGLFTIMTAGANRVWGPVGTFFGDNNHFGLVCVMMVPMFFYMYLQARNKFLKWGLFFMGFCTLVSIFGTQSRGAFVALGAMLFFLVWKSKRRMVGIIFMVFALGLGLVFMPQGWRDRMESIENYQDDASAQGRLTMWKFAIDVANDNPVLGGGFNVFYHEGYRAYYLAPGAEGRAVHSIYFEALGEHGYIGLILFLMLGITTYLTSNAIVKRTKEYPDLKWAQDLASMMQVSLVGYAAAGAFLNLATFDLFYHVIAITAITAILSNKEINKKIESAAAQNPAPKQPVRNLHTPVPAVSRQPRNK